jgi:hypothetical protein
MRIDNSADIRGLRNIMRTALVVADEIWKAHGRKEGITITCGLNGVHSARSLHPCGLAVDLRTRYWTNRVDQVSVFTELQTQLKAIDPNYGVQLESDHIHMQWKPPHELRHYY